MIYSLKGKLQSVEPNFIIIDVNGVGYGVKTTLTTISKLPQIEKEVFLYTHLHVREDVMELYGFYDQSELNCYKMLITVNGIGPKAALSILSDNTPEKFALTVASGDYKTLTKSAGIGAKGAQRIVLELKDKISKDAVASGITKDDIAKVSQSNSNSSEAISALAVLGYSVSDATNVISKLDANMSIEEMIKIGLKELSNNK